MMNNDAKAYWQKFIKALGELPANLRVSASYAGTRATTDQLLKLYLEGKKHAGSSLVIDYKTAGDPLPAVGDFWIILDSNDKARCICKTTRVVINRFRNVPEEIARAEGEGDLSVDYWQKTHAKFFEPFLKEWGVRNLWEEDVVTEFYQVYTLGK